MTIYQDLKEQKKSIAVIGLGYVGLPIAIEMAKYFKVIGFDVNSDRIQMMKEHRDPSQQLSSSDFQNKSISFTDQLEEIRSAHFFIVAVPTDIDSHKVPDLNPLRAASETVGKVIKKGDYVVFESTVFPGCTEEICLPIIEHQSGLTGGQDFKIGYSPERINPGPTSKKVNEILKIVSGCDPEAKSEIAKVYGDVITAGIYEAPTIKVAEAAKVIENTQRDINISLMNELAIIFDQLDIDTEQVIEAASTKWNFHPYKPGLVGGHCISVDPFYLIYKAKQVGYDPEVIAAGRRVNDYIPSFVAKKVVQSLLDDKKNLYDCRVLVMGVTYKENVSDIRNSKVFDMVKELEEYHLAVDCTDPYASAKEVKDHYREDLIPTPNRGDYDAIILAVGHEPYLSLNKENLQNLSKDKVVLFDLKGVLSPTASDKYWKL